MINIFSYITTHYKAVVSKLDMLQMLQSLENKHIMLMKVQNVLKSCSHSLNMYCRQFNDDYSMPCAKSL